MKPRLTLTVLALLFVLFLVVAPTARVLTEAWWYDALGYPHVYGTVLGTKIALGGAFGLIMLGVLVLNLLVARRSTWTVRAVTSRPPLTTRGLVLLSTFLSLVAGLDASSRWREWLLLRNGGDFGGSLDPLFGRDAGFYVFQLPFLAYVSSWLFVVLLVALGMTAFAHLAQGGVQVRPRSLSVAPATRRHFLTILAALLLAKAWDYHLETCGLLLQDHPLFVGASYADVHAKLPALRVLTVLACLAAVAVLVNAWVRGWKLSAVAVAALFLASFVGLGLTPTSVQRFVVAPNELERECPFIERAIRNTRFAYGLDRVDERPFAARTTLTGREVQANLATVQNVRLWDGPQLLEACSQLQEIRSYYTFFAVDNDRYRIGGRLMQTAISPRELDYDTPQIQGFINENLTYTHGFGVCMGPVTRISAEGLPEFYVENLPPQVSEKTLDIAEPRIYFGEHTPEFVFTNTAAREFDYPKGEENVYNQYAGKGGVPAGSLLRKALFAIRFGEGKIFLSSDIREGSRVLFHRSVRDRASRVTPLVYYDADPYMVVSEGRLYWILDGYTTSASMPYARRQDLGSLGPVSYIRNSVKAVVDAYDGTVQAYVADAKDPIVKALASAFPGVYKPLDDMSADLRAHLRYPVSLFGVQADVLATYHMDDPQVFYNREDLWRLPVGSEAGGDMRPYYTISRLPGEPTEEFIAMVPFVPEGKQNMVAWMAARCDGASYGQVRLYLLPKDKNVYGPGQIQGRIQQDPRISEQVTLWNQMGSKVQWGELLVIPMEESLMYVQPLYLAASGQEGRSAAIPELKRVIVAHGSNIAMDTTIDGAVAAVFKMKVADVAAPSPPTEPSPPTSTKPSEAAPGWQALARQARQQLEDAEAAQRQGDWAAYGEQLKRLKETLLQMEALSRPPSQQAPATPTGERPTSEGVPGPP